MRHALLTGFPGFIGRRLVKRLLDDAGELRVTAVVEGRMAEEAERLAAPWNGRLEIVIGDIADPHLALSDAEWERLTGSVDTVFHLAAIYNLAVPLELAERVNVGGTGNVLDLCAACDGLERLVYVSTAYVAGRRLGTVYEHELVLGQEFKNHYERTKFQAEAWVRERMGDIPTTILRPAIVVGDSQTGETEKFDGPYYLLRSVAQAQRHGRPTVQLGREDAPFNVVPVDYVVASMAAAASDDAMIGQTLHLVDPEPLSAAALLVALSQEYAGRAPQGRLPAWILDFVLRFAPVRKLLSDTPRESIAYLNHPVRFDTRSAVALLEPHGLRPPNFHEYVKPMVAFFRAHEDDPAYSPK
ncbi:MAG: SDR family oxidoreductase [Thermoleophilaceae bacterium]